MKKYLTRENAYVFPRDHPDLIWRIVITIFEREKPESVKNNIDFFSPLCNILYIFIFIKTKLHSSIPYQPIRYPSIRYLSIWYPSIRYPSIQYPSIWYPSIRYPSIRYPFIRHPSIRYPSFLPCPELPQRTLYQSK